MSVFSNLFSLGEKERVQHIGEITKEFAFRRDLALVMIYGIDNAKIEKANKKEIMRITKNTPFDIKKGIPELSVLVNPTAGFMLVIDFSRYKGKFLGNVKLESSQDFQNAFYCLTDLNTIPGEMCFSFAKPVLRFSYSITREEIIEAMIRINNVLALCQEVPLSQSTALTPMYNDKKSKPKIDKPIEKPKKKKRLPCAAKRKSKVYSLYPASDWVS